MKKSTIIIIIAVVVVVSVALGITFAPCTVTLDYCNEQRVYLPGSGTFITNQEATIETVKVTRFSTYSPPREEVWYKDRGRTIPWVSGNRVTGNITLYAG